jgi:hypothetical protein
VAQTPERITATDEPEHRVRFASLSNPFNFGRASRAAFAFIAGITAATLIAGCGNRMDTEPLVPSAIVITSPSGTTGVAGTIQFSATVTDANGHTIAVTPTWSVVNGGGTITSDGLFTAGDSTGVFLNTVVATTGTVSSASTVTVTAGALASITVTPDTVTVAIRATQQFTAVGKDAHGNVVSISPTWSVAASGGTIDPGTGVFTAGAVAGTFANTVRATSGSISGTASVTIPAGQLESITVTPSPVSVVIGAQQTFTAVGQDDDGNVVAITPTWTSNSGGTITSGGVFTAGSVAGTFTNDIRASVGVGCGAISGRATVTVLPGPLTMIVVSPPSALLFPGQTQQFSAAGLDSAGNDVSLTGTIWSVATASAAAGTISPTGLFTASGAMGGYPNAIVATEGSTSGTATVTVMFIPPPSIVPIVPGNLGKTRRRP